MGHTGTLDPFASGLLIMCVGRATRLTEYFHLLPKTYRAVATLGQATDTDDDTGRIIATSEAWQSVGEDQLIEAAGRLTGESDQIPPAFSAKKVAGRRAYDIARGGGDPALAAVTVSIHRLEVIEVNPPHVELEVEVSTGTYVRALARDLGREIGCHAHLSSLRRTRIGPFEVSGAARLADIQASGVAPVSLMSPAESLRWLEPWEIDGEERTSIEVGKPIPFPDGREATDQPVPLLAGGRLIAMAREESGKLRPEKVFPEG